MAKKPAVDRERFPHTYLGPTTRQGLPNGEPCRIIGSRAGGKRIATPDGKHWIVGTLEVERAARTG